MPVSRKRKNRGKGAGAREQRRRVAQRSAAIRESLRGQIPRDDTFASLALLGALPRRARRIEYSFFDRYMVD